MTKNEEENILLSIDSQRRNLLTERNSFCQWIFLRDILLSVNLPEGYPFRRLTDTSIFFCHFILSEGISSVGWTIRRIYFCQWIFQKDTLLSVDLPEGHHFQNRCIMQKDSAKRISFCIYEDCNKLYNK